MREYKFRGKRLDNGEWVYGFGVWQLDSVNGSPECWMYTPNGIVVVDPATVGQYTGLQCNVTDEEWYERDILTPDPHSKRTENEVICYDRHQGKYKSVPISLYLANAGNGGWTGFEIKSYQKRIGNVIDNPELLEG